MDNEVISKAESDEDILTFDAPDEVLERAGSAESKPSLGCIALTRGTTASGHSKCLAAPAAWDIGYNPPRGAENQSRCSRDRFVIQASMIEWAVISASCRVPITDFSFGNSLSGK